jgi:hypothetical protein
MAYCTNPGYWVRSNHWIPTYSEKTCPNVTLFIINTTWPDLSLNLGRKSATNRLSYGMAVDRHYLPDTVLRWHFSKLVFAWFLVRMPPVTTAMLRIFRDSPQSPMKAPRHFLATSTTASFQTVFKPYRHRLRTKHIKGALQNIMLLR